MLLQQEFQLVHTAPAAPGMDSKFSLKANSASREVVAVMEIEDGAVLEMVIKLPTSSPLRRADVACRRRVSSLQQAMPVSRHWLSDTQVHGQQRLRPPLREACLDCRHGVCSLWLLL